MDLVCTSGQMVGDLKAVGRKTNYMEGVFTRGQTVEATTVSTWKIVNKGLEFTFGLTVRNMRGIGRMESSMAKVNLPICKENQGLVNGWMESV